MARDGIVPSGWKELTLGDLTAESAFGPRFSSDLYSPKGNIGTIRTTDIDEEGHINYQTIPYANIPEDSIKSHFLNDGDLLITRSGTCGVPCIFSQQEKPVVAGAFLIRFILKNNINPQYLHSLLKLDSIQENIYKMASGGVQKNLTGTNLKKLKLIIPPIKEQEIIIEIISLWSTAIAATEQLLANSQMQKKALMQQLLTGEKRFAGFNCKWEKTKIGVIAKISKGKALSSSGLVEGIYPVFAGGKSSPYNHNEYTHENVITVSASGAYAGYVAFHQRKIWASDCSVVEAKKGNSIKYIYQYLLFQQNKIYALQSGGAQPHIYPKDLEGIKIKAPPLDEQEKITSVLEVADQEIMKLQQKVAFIKEEKKALMQLLLTGKRRVVCA